MLLQTLRLIVLAASLCSHSAFAQEIGAAPDSDRLALNAEASLSYLARPLLIGARFGIGAERETVAVRVGYSYGDALFAGTTVNTASLSAGLVQDVNLFRFAALIGPAVLWGRHHSLGPDREYRRVGAVIEASALIVLADHIAFGGEVHATVNGVVRSVGGGPVLRLSTGF